MTGGATENLKLEKLRTAKTNLQLTRKHHPSTPRWDTFGLAMVTSVDNNKNKTSQPFHDKRCLKLQKGCLLVLQV